jgi:hypothetical protein
MVDKDSTTRCKDHGQKQSCCPFLSQIDVPPGQKLIVGDEKVGDEPRTTDENARCAYCCVLYGDNSEYVLLLLVLARRLTLLGTKHPLLVLPTTDVPSRALGALTSAGCHVLPPVDYLAGHPALFRQADGRHRNVLTKLRVLGLKGIKKVLLIDADILPRRSLDPLFEFDAPAAMLMPTNLDWVTPPTPGSPVPAEWLRVDAATGRGARVNCGVCLLTPDPQLLVEIEREVDPRRNLTVNDSNVVHSIFGKAWCPSWTPEEDVLTRALVTHGAQLVHIGCAFNFEVMGDVEYYEGMPVAKEHASLNFVQDAAVFHFVGQTKPSGHACFVGLGQLSIQGVMDSIRSDYAADDPREVTLTAFAEWFTAFDELCTHAATAWGLNFTDLCGWCSKGIFNGSYSDSWGGGTMTVRHIGATVIAINPRQRWSPAKGSTQGSTIFMFGMEGVLSDGVLTWGNGSCWTLLGAEGIKSDGSSCQGACKSIEDDHAYPADIDPVCKQQASADSVEGQGPDCLGKSVAACNDSDKSPSFPVLDHVTSYLKDIATPSSCLEKQRKRRLECCSRRRKIGRRV